MREPIDVALFGEKLERSLHSALVYDARPQPEERDLRRGSAGLHALDAQLTKALKTGWVTLNLNRGTRPPVRFCLTFCGVAHFKAWVWVLPIGQLFDGAEPQRLIADHLRIMRTLAPEAKGVIWLTPSPRITQFELTRAPQKARDLLKDIGVSRDFKVVLPSQGVAGVFELLTEAAPTPNAERGEAQHHPQGEERRLARVMSMNRALKRRSRLSVTTTEPQVEPLTLDELVPILEGEHEGVDQQVWRVERPYFMSQTLMTQGLFDELMGVERAPEALPFDLPDLPYLKVPVKEVNLREPVSRVSWLKATQVCNALSASHQLPSYYRYERPDGSLCDPGDPPDEALFERGGWAVYADLTASSSFRLPKSDEWCYAASARQMYPYSGGEDPEHLAWSAHNSGSKLHPVASLNPNRWGLYDMNGLLWEWCEDGPSDAQIERSERWGGRQGMRLLCDGATQAKWLLGGSWANHPWVFPIGERLSELPTYADDFMGLRVVCSAEISENDSTQTRAEG